jgi:hypothetical protein
MPRINKGPRLYKRKTKRKNGRLIANAVWTIRDGEREVATGIFAGEAERKPPKAAEDALARYITSKYQPPRRTRDIEDIDIADVLAIYHAHREGAYLERKARQVDIKEFADRIGRLNDFFGGMMLVEVNAHSCAKYVKARWPGWRPPRSGRPARSDQSPLAGRSSPGLGPRGTSSERTRPRPMADAQRGGGAFVDLLAVSRSANTTSLRSEKSKN